MLRVGVIGCGTKGGEICAAIDSGVVDASLSAIALLRRLTAPLVVGT